MSFEEALRKLNQLISRQNDYFGYFIDHVTLYDCAEEGFYLFSVANHRIFIAGFRNLKICLRATIAN